MLSLPLLAALVGASLTTTTSSFAQPLKRDATISCEAKSAASWLYQGDASYAQGGTLAGFKGPNLSYDGASGDLTPFQVQSAICNSTSLNLSAVNHAGSNYDDPDPIKLFIVDQPGKCLALSSTTQANTYITAVDCSDDDTVDAQASQFFLRAYKYESILPYGNQIANPSTNWGLQIYDSPEGNIIANPNPCFSGQTCQTDNQISLRVG